MFDKPAHVKDLSETGRQSLAQNRVVSESWWSLRWTRCPEQIQYQQGQCHSLYSKGKEKLLPFSNQQNEAEQYKSRSNYSRASGAQTLMARIPRLFQIHS